MDCFIKLNRNIQSASAKTVLLPVTSYTAYTEVTIPDITKYRELYIIGGAGDATKNEKILVSELKFGDGSQHAVFVYSNDTYHFYFAIQFLSATKIVVRDIVSKGWQNNNGIWLKILGIGQA